MCVAIPGKVISIEGNKAVVDIAGNRMDISIGVVSPRVGDYVLLHAGYAVEIVSMEQADEIIRLLNELEETFREDD